MEIEIDDVISVEQHDLLRFGYVTEVLPGNMIVFWFDVGLENTILFSTIKKWIADGDFQLYKKVSLENLKI